MKISGGKRNGTNTGACSRPLVSIVIVTFNATEVLQRAFDSIRNQPFQNIELLVFDGASTDGTVEIIKRNEHIISYWQSENDNGIYDAMNKAVKHAAGQWVYFMGADDRLLDGFSKTAAMLKNENTLYYGFCLIGSKRTNAQLTAYEIAKINVCHQAVFYPIAVFKKYSYNTSFIVFADHALNIQCWGDNGIPKKYLPFEIASYNDKGFSGTSRHKDNAFINQKKDWIKKYMGKYIYLRFVFRKWKESKKKESDFI
jgi:glycosyltransferase involved in cell wall biosynthesis